MSCNKRIYTTKSEAKTHLEMLQRMRAKEGASKVELNHYYCNKCKGYHLTSWTKSKVKRVKEYKSRMILRDAERMLERQGISYQL